MMLQSCCIVCATSILSSAVRFHSALAHVELEKELLPLGIKFRRYAKEEANQQRVTQARIQDFEMGGEFLY